jgi:hypothetical protein
MLTMRDPLMTIIITSLLVILSYFYGYSYSHSQIQIQRPTTDMITYNKQSNFIKEFNIPNSIQELGLKGIILIQTEVLGFIMQQIKQPYICDKFPFRNLFLF